MTLYIHTENIARTLKNLILRTFISIILSMGITLLFNTHPLIAQQIDRQLIPLDENDFQCLQQLICVSESEALREKGWVIKFDESITNYPQARTARMNGKDLSLTAHYNKAGNLIRGVYELQNAALPRVLLSHLAGNNFKGWEMTANKITIQDFNIASAEYDVILKKMDEHKTITFTHSDIINMSKSKTVELAENQ